MIDFRKYVAPLREPVRFARELEIAMLDHWLQKAGELLNRSAASEAAYRGALRFAGFGRKATVALRGRLPNMLERGMGPQGIGSSGPYDMRRHLLRGSGVRTGPKGRYRAIPVGNGELRTISEHGSGWQHPGIDPAGVRNEVVKDIGALISEAARHV